MNPKIVQLGPYFIAAKDFTTNTLHVTNDLTILERPLKSFTVHNPNWILDIPKELDQGLPMKVSFSYCSYVYTH